MWHYLENLTTRSMRPGFPWELNPEPPAENICMNHDDRQAWYQNPRTRHVFYTPWEGVNPNVRVGPENPPHSLDGFTADVDHPHTREKILEMINSLETKPTWLEQSLGKRWRFNYLILDGPFLLPKDAELVKEFLMLVKMDLGIESLHGLDEGSWANPNRTYCRGYAMERIISGPSLTSACLHGLLMQAARNLVKRAGSPAVALEKIEGLIKNKWPEWTWPGDFKLGSQGPSWWIEGSTSPKSAIVKADGMFTFSAHAAKGFYAWDDILGKGVMEQDSQRRIQEATKNFWFDGMSFFEPREATKECPGGGFWQAKEPAMRRTLVALGLSPDRVKKAQSEVDQALHYMEHPKRVDSAGPIIYRPEGLINLNGRRHLNTSNVHPIAYAAEPQIWGPDGNFPFISLMYDTVFFPRTNQFEHYFSWLHVWYRDTMDGNPHQGHAIFILGGPNIGKTLNTYHIVGPMMGGVEDAGGFLSGEDDFGGEMFKKACWAIDDQTMAAKMQSLRDFTSLVKRTVSNKLHKMKVKFEMPLLIIWDGRLIVTGNLDPYSMSCLPATDESLLDKVNFYRWIDGKSPGQRLSNTFFPKDVEKVIARELPYFARWVYDYEIPDRFIGANRYRIVSFQEPTLLHAAFNNSGNAHIVELLLMFLEIREKFAENKSAGPWVGTTAQLLAEIGINQGLAGLIRSTTPNQMAKYLGALVDSEAINISSTTNSAGLRLWSICRR